MTTRREEERLELIIGAAEDAGFGATPSVDNLKPYFECYDCGAILHNWLTHKEWHEKMKFLEQLRLERAYGKT